MQKHSPFEFITPFTVMSKDQSGMPRPQLAGQLFVKGIGHYNPELSPEYCINYDVEVFSFTTTGTGSTVPISQWVGNTLTNLTDAHNCVVSHLRKVFGLEEETDPIAARDILITKINRDRTDRIIHVDYRLPKMPPLAVEITETAFATWLYRKQIAASFYSYWSDTSMPLKSAHFAQYLAETPGWIHANNQQHSKVLNVVAL